MELVIESTGVADRVAVGVPPPQGRVGGFAIGTSGSLSASSILKSYKYHFLPMQNMIFH